MTCLPSRSGRIASSSSCAQLGDADLELVHAPGQLGGLALVAGGAVAARSGRRGASYWSPASRDEAADGGVGPARRRSRGSAGGGTRACATASTSSVEYLQRLHAVAGHAGADHLVVVERHAPSGRTSGSWACRRRGAAPPSRTRRSGSSWPPPRWCGRARPCGGGSGPARGASPAARGGTGRPGPCRPGTRGRPTGRATTSSLSSSSRMRSAETMLEPVGDAPAPPRRARRRARGRSRR